ncbi:hypothetical protein FHE72_04565 [Rossellomorea vietnamensis]|uniref:Uncharacterized protein n=1 Tax=Rossellomorea vietnamensis TaxID=218284 RepID=A0A6I6UCF6_9BACI|nr:hypothetical protein [Rossellomorea vietnamensis]QHE60394.1 hypothetical protein FHE72_04565 [Rossellomorea vietnamensis]
MKEEFISFYKKELGVWSLVYKNMNKLGLTVYIFFFLLFIILFLWTILIQNILFIFLLLFLVFLEGTILNKHNKRILEKKHQILIVEQGVVWGGLPLAKRKSEMLERFVIKKLDSENQLKKLIDVLNKEAERRKFSGIFVRGLGVGLFIPLWNYFIRWLFGNEIANVNMALVLFLSVCLLIIVIIYIASMLKMIVMDLFDRDSTRIKDLANMLEDISIKELDFTRKIY